MTKKWYFRIFEEWSIIKKLGSIEFLSIYWDNYDRSIIVLGINIGFSKDYE